MDAPTRPLRSSPALRLARQAWRIQYEDSARSLSIGERALARSQVYGDRDAEGWARLTRGFYLMRYASPTDAMHELALAHRLFDQTGDRVGDVLAAIGNARCRWLDGDSRGSLERMMALRDEGMRRLPHAERAMMLNVIAGCHSSLGESGAAFAYMYQALREASPARGRGFDVVLMNNLGHELLELGDSAEALDFLEEAIRRCERLANPNLMGTLLGNRIGGLTDLQRPAEALPDILRVIEIYTSGGHRGDGFEAMAITALRAGDEALGTRLIAMARAAAEQRVVHDDQVTLVIAEGEQLKLRGATSDAVELMERALPLPGEGISTRTRCVFYETLAGLHEQVGNCTRALAHLRTWQVLHVERALLASKARHQAALLETELLRLRRERDEIEARHRASERAKFELEVINRRLSQKMDEVQGLQAALQQQAVRDFLTGCFNRRYLNDVLPSMLALAERDREPLGVAIIDLDHFKAVNDRHGHVAGDQLLAAFGDLLGRRLRRSDVACRFGGEEFCVLMPRTSATAAAGKIELLLKLWRAMSFPVDGSTLHANTFSAGIVDSLLVPGPVQELLKAADQCLFEAKRFGRDRVIVYAADRPASPA